MILHSRPSTTARTCTRACATLTSATTPLLVRSLADLLTMATFMLLVHAVLPVVYQCSVQAWLSPVLERFALRSLLTSLAPAITQHTEKAC